MTQITYILGPNQVITPAEVAELTAKQALHWYNLAANKLGEKVVARFADSPTARKRTLGILERLPKIVQPQPSPKAAPAASDAEKAARKPRSKRFRYCIQAPTVNVRSKRETLRSRCELLLSRPDGATFEDVAALVKQFDQERGKETVNLERRTYELIRIMHYVLGHGLDDRTGTIRVVKAQKELPGMAGK